jgi:hypothetical protein
MKSRFFDDLILKSINFKRAKSIARFLIAEGRASKEARQGGRGQKRVAKKARWFVLSTT